MENLNKTFNKSISDKARIKNAAEFFQVSESFLRHAIMNRRIPSYRLGGAVFVSLSEIEEMIKKNRVYTGI